MDEKISLIGKTVKTIDSSEGIDVTEIVSFMYPNFVIREEISFDYENDVIYVGPYARDIKDILSHGTKSFIAVANMGIQDIDLTSRETSIDILYSKWNRTPGKEIRETLGDMIEPDYWRYFKTYWVTGRSSIEDSGVSLWKLYNVLGKQRYEILKCYFTLRETHSDSSIFSGLLGFINRSLNPDENSSQRGRYNLLLKEFAAEYGASAVQVIRMAYLMPCSTDQDREYRTLWTLMHFGKGAML